MNKQSVCGEAHKVYNPVSNAWPLYGIGGGSREGVRYAGDVRDVWHEGEHGEGHWGSIPLGKSEVNGDLVCTWSVGTPVWIPP
jgi:hypothetical protein